MARISIAVVLFFALATRTMAEPPMIVIDPKSAVCTNFLGYGAEWDPAAYPLHGVTAADRAVIAKRLEWMRMPLVRMMILAKWVYLGNGRYDYTNAQARALLDHLDICQKLGVTVFLTDWGCVRDWVRIPEVANTADPKYAEVIGAYLDELVNKRGYSCIKYFILVNEPNCEAGGYDAWKTGMLNVHHALVAHKLDRKITQVGSDAAQCDTTWHRSSASQLADIIGVYDLHYYVDDPALAQGQLENHFRGLWDTARKLDPKAVNKPMIAGEAGINTNAEHPRGNRDIETYKYGLMMADYAVQVARAGSAAASAWMLDDNSHQNFFWGLWSNKPKGMKLRPWFYTWGLMARYVPRGSSIFSPAQPVPGLRVLAALAPDRSGRQSAGWTFVLVNRTAAEATVSLQVPGGPTVKLKRFLYSEKDRAADADGFPVPMGTDPANLAKGFAVSCPANSAVILTALE